jgi:hypothetical protein
MNEPSTTSKRRARLRVHYPTVTLAEAMTHLAFGKAFDGRVLLRFRHRNRGMLSIAAIKALDAVGRQLAALALDGKLVLRGQRQSKKGGPLDEAANIPPEIFADGVYFEPSSDVIEMDCLLDRHFEGAGYPRYRHVRLDVRQIQPYLADDEPSATRQKDATVSPAAAQRGFNKWAEDWRAENGVYPSRRQAYEDFAKPKGLSRDWSRKAIAALSKTHRMGSGAPKGKRNRRQN